SFPTRRSSDLAPRVESARLDPFGVGLGHPDAVGFYQHRAGIGPLPRLTETVGGLRSPGDNEPILLLGDVRAGERELRFPPAGVDLHGPVLAGIDRVSLLLDLRDARIEPVLAFGGELAAGDRIDEQVPPLLVAGTRLGAQPE